MRYIGGGTNSFRQNRPKEKLLRRILNKFKSNKKLSRPSGPVCTFRNPYRKEQEKNKPWRRNLALVLLGLTILAWLFFIFFSPYFRIKNILYSGLEIIKKEDIDNDVRQNLVREGGWWPKNNFFFMNENKIARFVNEHYLLNNITVTKIFPNTLEIDLEEKISSVIYDNSQAYFLLDQEGRAIKELGKISADEFSFETASTTTTTSTPTSTVKVHEPNFQRAKTRYGAYPLIFDRRNTTTTLNEIVLPEKIVQAVIFWSEGAEKQGMPRVKYFELEGIYSGIKAYNESIWDVLIQPQNDWQAQVDVIKNLLRTARPKEYIDVRYEGRVYWK